MGCCSWLIVLMMVCSFGIATPRNPRDLEKMDTMRLVSTFGHQASEHTIVTDDGYILKAHRMGRARGVPVLLVHGILGRSDMWVLRGPSSDLAFNLVEAGYDVWMGNVRGSAYSKNHLSMNATGDAFWEFSWHEMGYYDVPATIDYILGHTGARQLFYIGHSMGTTMFFAMASSRPEYNLKVQAFIALAPVVYQTEYPPIYHQLAKFRFQILDTFKKQRIHEMWPVMPWVASTEANLCRDGSPLQGVCLEVIAAILGRDIKQMDKSLLPMIIEHLSSTNPLTVFHYGQGVASGRFQWLDFGPAKNLKNYGTIEPPDYDLSLVTAPVYIYYSTNDLLSYEKDVLRLARQLHNVKGLFKVPYKHFNHIDYLWAKDANRILYKDIVHLVKKLSQ